VLSWHCAIAPFTFLPLSLLPPNRTLVHLDDRSGRSHTSLFLSSVLALLPTNRTPFHLDDRSHTSLFLSSLPTRPQLRELRDCTTTTLADKVVDKLTGLKGLQKRLFEMSRYIENVEKGVLPVNHEIMYNLQDIFNLSPNLNVESVVKSFTVTTNDNMLVIYLSSLIRSILALHDLIDNKLTNRKAEAVKEEKNEKGEFLFFFVLFCFVFDRLLALNV
jgi:hypothetical protein